MAVARMARMRKVSHRGGAAWYRENRDRDGASGVSPIGIKEPGMIGVMEPVLGS